jgi:conjugal transfer pilus assembly protein TraV
MNRMPTLSGFVVVATAAMVVSGCASFAGVGGTSEYSCKAPEGVKCDSVSGTYYNAVENNLPSQRQGGRATPQNEAATTRMEALAGKRSVTSAVDVTPALAPLATGSGSALPPAAYTSMPLRSPARVLRLWVKPWEDADGDLMDQVYVYVPVDNGRWLVDHAQRQIRDAYAPVKAPRTVQAPDSDADRESAKVDPRVPMASSLEQRLQAARAIFPSAANTNGADDAE